MSYSTIHLVGIMAVAGLCGGTLNYLLSVGNERAHRLKDWGTDVLLGVVASFLIPVFLNTISSTLVSSLLKGEGSSLGEILVFFGFCLLAAVSSRKFITTLSDKILQEASDAKEKAEEAAEAINSTIVEPDADRDQYEPTKETLDGLSQDERLVLRAMKETRYQLRSTSGLAKDVNRDKIVTYEALSLLSQKGYLAKITRTKGDRWALTKFGQEAQITEQSDNTTSKASKD